MMTAFEVGKQAARQGENIECCPFEKEDPRCQQWVDGYKSWRCKETFDLFEAMG